MRPLALGVLLIPVLLTAAEVRDESPENILVHISTWSALEIAQIVARDEGHNIENESLKYDFDSLDDDGERFLEGYVTIHFTGNGRSISSYSINESTGQVIDAVTCTIFDYPDLKPIQNNILRMSRRRLKTPEELADEAGCLEMTILSEPDTGTGENH